MSNVYKIIAGIVSSLVITIIIITIIAIVATSGKNFANLIFQFFNSYLFFKKYSQNVDTASETSEIKYTEKDLFDAVLKGDLDGVKALLTESDIDVNAKLNDEE